MKIKLGAGTLTMSEISCYTNGIVCGPANIKIEYVCTDSREADEHTLFVAFTGERVDGHDYVLSSYQAGCRCFLTERKIDIPNDACLVLVHDSTQALLQMAAEPSRWKRRVSKIKTAAAEIKKIAMFIQSGDIPITPL